LSHWRHYLEGIPFEVLTDHHNLKWFMETKILNHRQVRAYLELSKYNFVITHRPGATNPADGPSRRPDYMAEAKNPAQKQNQAFVKPLKTLLTKTKHNDPAICGAMMIRSRALDQIPKELLRTLEAPSRDDLDDDSNISSDVSSSDDSDTR
jgi:hypothetical protein